MSKGVTHWANIPVAVQCNMAGIYSCRASMLCLHERKLCRNMKGNAVWVYSAFLHDYICTIFMCNQFLFLAHTKAYFNVLDENWTVAFLAEWSVICLWGIWSLPSSPWPCQELSCYSSSLPMSVRECMPLLFLWKLLCVPGPRVTSWHHHCGCSLFRLRETSLQFSSFHPVTWKQGDLCTLPFYPCSKGCLY